MTFSKSSLGVLAAMSLAASAFAQPAEFTDLGNHNTTTEQFSVDVETAAGNAIKWYRIVLPDAPAASSGYVDFWTVNGGFNPMTDTEVGIFDSAGNLVVSDDDNGVGLFTAISFGGGSGQMLGDAGNLGGNGLAEGENGPLPAGTYWVAVGRYPVEFAGGFSAVSTSALTQTTTTLNIAVQPSTAPYPPNVGVIAVNPNPINSGQAALFTSVVNPGGNPASTALAVSIDLTSFGGPAAQAMNDAGTNGDAVAGDGTFSFQYSVPASALEMPYAVTVNAIDAQSRTGTRSGNFNVVAPIQWEEFAQGGADAGDLAETAQVVAGSGTLTSIGGNSDSTSDVDLYLINICEPANFLASTDNVTSVGDTQLWLFTTSGVGITHNDDKAGSTIALRSQLTSVNTASLAAGEYVLGISRYNRDPVDFGAQALWAACAEGGFICETGPTGPGAANPVAAWTGTAGGTGIYKITLQGVCYAGSGNECPADLDNGSGTGVSDDAVTIDDLLYFLVQFEAGALPADLDNGTGTGTTDNAVTIDDLLYFLVRFEAGC